MADRPIDTRESRNQTLLASIGLLILRLGIGGYMFTHGIGKVQMLIAGEFEMLGDPIRLGSVPSLVLIVFAEFVCALLVTVGLATCFAAVPLVIAMAVAALIVHGSDPWTSEQAARLFMAGKSSFPVSKEPAMMYLTVFLALVFIGPGRLSLDGWIRSRRRRGSSGRDMVPAPVS